MNFLHSILLGFRLGQRSLAIIWRDKSLLVFPFISLTVALLIFGNFYLTVGPDKMQLMLNTLRNEQGVQTINFGYYIALIVAMLFITIVATAMNFALAACTYISIQENRDSKLRDGFSVATRRAAGIALWSLFSMTLGVFFTLLDEFRRSSMFVRRNLGGTWQNITMLTIPIAVIEGRNLIASSLKSRRMMRETWGSNLSARFGTAWFILLLNTPLIVKYITLQTSGVGLTLLFTEVALVYFACTIIVAQTAKAVLRVVLYRFAETGEAYHGFSHELLASAFESHVVTIHALPSKSARREKVKEYALLGVEDSDSEAMETLREAEGAGEESAATTESDSSDQAPSTTEGSDDADNDDAADSEPKYERVVLTNSDDGKQS